MIQVEWFDIVACVGLLYVAIFTYAKYQDDIFAALDTTFSTIRSTWIFMSMIIGAAIVDTADRLANADHVPTYPDDELSSSSYDLRDTRITSVEDRASDSLDELERTLRNENASERTPGDRNVRREIDVRFDVEIDEREIPVENCGSCGQETDSEDMRTVYENVSIGPPRKRYKAEEILVEGIVNKAATTATHRNEVSALGNMDPVIDEATEITHPNEALVSFSDALKAINTIETGRVTSSEKKLCPICYHILFDEDDDSTFERAADALPEAVK